MRDRPKLVANDGHDVTWLATLEENGRTQFRVGRNGAELIAEWPGLAILRAHRSSSKSELTFADGVDERWKRKLERGLARAMLAQLRGHLTLHASAVGNESNAILLVGASGAGKSTLAAFLAKRAALNLVSDDTAPMTFHADLTYVGSGDPEPWLWADAGEALGGVDTQPGKAPIDISSVAIDKLRVAAVVVLTYGEVEAPELRAIHGHAALVPLLAATVRLIIDEQEVQLHEIAQLERLAQTTSIFELVRPRSLGRISESADLIVGLLTARSK